LLSGITLIATGDAMMGEYTQVEINIDGIDYYIYYTQNVITGVSNSATHRFEFN
jgi:hypothetical protein